MKSVGSGFWGRYAKQNKKSKLELKITQNINN
jgi:hypothetical protein